MGEGGWRKRFDDWKKEGSEPKMINAKKTAIGFDSETNVRPGETVRLEVSPRGHFKGDRFVVGKGAESFRIEDIKVNGASQMPAPGGVPAIAFSENALAPGFDMTVCKHGEKIEVLALNTSNEPSRFTAAIYGKIAPVAFS